MKCDVAICNNEADRVYICESSRWARVVCAGCYEVMTKGVQDPASRTGYLDRDYYYKNIAPRDPQKNLAMQA